MVAVSEFNETQRKLAEALESKFKGAEIKEIFLHKKEFIFARADQVFAAKFSFNPKGVIMIWDGVEIEKAAHITPPIVRSAGKTDTRLVQTPPPDKSEVESEIEERSSPSLRGRNIEPLPDWNQTGVVRSFARAGKKDVPGVLTPPDKSEIEPEVKGRSSPSLRGRNIESLPEWSQAGVVRGQGSQISRPREHK